MPRNALMASIIFVLALTAAVVSFVEGNWFGVVWVLLAGVASNIAWFYLRRERQERAAAERQ
ncbi:hypothetical protein CFP65_2075 [Kitasatospora sp. MMS16-BH015]|uniref:hypothetical protein n=1 Tax=Kitasatospora sp. MMS16-BH015 TaxID=2018025 RepID=UPI000CA2B58B|nr:hypothetical protein [Kitasatospora sp. MMS16-BH015]AUG76933.1 hypothetical protein CFP65_2075 [Kitasatospora sp. MMS16-BH015]